ncbi:MAG: hypothetical protein LBL13_12060 [Bacteroidales bacterium]|jgi:hypothetical protein|nr:hypothetical protein [Bacteroidales bacterium]
MKKALRQKGYTFTSNSNEANIVIFYEYGISEPKEYTYQRIVPVWGQTGIASSTTTQRKNTWGETTYKTTNTPSYGQVGGTAITETDIKYMGWANITAYDADFYRQTGEDKMLWLTEITSEGWRDDLRIVFPYMMAASKEYIEQSSGHKITVKIDSEDKRWHKFNETLMTVIVKKPASKRELPSMTVHQDVYKDGQLFIKAGTPVDLKVQKKISRHYTAFSGTISVNGGSVLIRPIDNKYSIYSSWFRYSFKYDKDSLLLDMVYIIGVKQ